MYSYMYSAYDSIKHLVSHTKQDVGYTVRL